MEEAVEIYNTIDTYSAWKDYRLKVTDYILKHCPDGGSLTVFGAGRAADIDLSCCSQSFDKIILVDRDEEALKQAISHYNVEEKCQLVVKDFVGLTSKHFAKSSEYCSANVARCLRSKCLDEFENGFCKIIEEQYSENKSYVLDFSDVQADYVVALGTHSQLNNNFSAQWMTYRQILESALGVSAKDYDSWVIQGFDRISARIERLQRQNTDFITERFNQALLRTYKKNIFLGFETGNTGVENSIIDGAYNGLEDIKRRASRRELDIAASANFVWPFDTRRGLFYDISILVC